MNELQKVMADYPDLGDFGFFYKSKLSGYSPEEFQEQRKGLKESSETFDLCVGWIATNLTPRKTINNDCSAYGIKHMAEPEIGYSTNGVFIAALIHCGYQFRRLPNNPNAWFNVSGESLSVIRKRIYPR